MYKCHICNAIRPNDKISVRVKNILMAKVNIGQHNIRYCNDRKDCIEKSKTFTHFKLDKIK